MRSTYRPAEDISTGAANAALKPEGSYLYIYKRHGRNGFEIVARRLNHTPGLVLHLVFDEPTDIYKYHYHVRWNEGEGRVFTNPYALSAGGEDQPQELQLWMHPKSKLGWYYCEPGTDHDLILKVLVETARAEKRHIESRKGHGPVILPLFSGQCASMADKPPTGMHVSNSAKAAIQVKPQNVCLSFKDILALKGAYYDYLCPISFDLGNGVPGFEKKGPNGEPMGKKVNVGMQGASMLPS